MNFWKNHPLHTSLPICLSFTVAQCYQQYFCKRSLITQNQSANVLPHLHQSKDTRTNSSQTLTDIKNKDGPFFSFFNNQKMVNVTLSSSKYSSGSYPANNPTEDRYMHGSNQGWDFAVVMDGHGGWQVAEFVANNIEDLLSTNFNRMVTAKNVIDEIAAEETLIEIFQRLEIDYINCIRGSYRVGFGDVASVGSCVLVVLKKGDRLLIANCGDCRAILGTETDSSKRDGKASFVSTRINRDHNARVRLEQINLLQSHPNEGINSLVRCKNPHACYVKGRLQLTRSIGDLYLKYQEFNGSPDRIRGRHIPEPFTPPYVSHVPDVHHLRLESKDRFLVLGSDGLWDYLSDQEAVDIVASYLQSLQHKQAVDEKHVSGLLITRALEIAAAESHLTLQELKSIPQGSKRRNVHDDTTAVVMFFDRPVGLA